MTTTDLSLEEIYNLALKTLKFNGYGDDVASLYSGMDLRKYY